MFLLVILGTFDQCPHHIDTSWLCSLSLKVLGAISKRIANYHLTPDYSFFFLKTRALPTMEMLLTIITISGGKRYLDSEILLCESIIMGVLEEAARSSQSPELK